MPDIERAEVESGHDPNVAEALLEVDPVDLSEACEALSAVLRCEAVPWNA